MPTRRAAIYARISVAQEASVSIDRQVEAAQQYASARGWQVVGTFKDDGVSASEKRPEDRAGWRELLEAPQKYDAVIIWKIDRLSRKLLDFLHADESLQARKAGLVGVEDPIDMTTPQGRAFAQILAVFGQMEADSIRARVADARVKLLKDRRVVGGKVPFGWRSVPNPDGPGLVLAHDPDRIDYVRGMAERVLRGNSIYSVVQWLDEVGAPTPTGRGSWVYGTVERILRHPILAGMTPFNPGSTTKERGSNVLRDGDGLPVVDESVAILPVADWRALVAKLDDNDSAQSRPRALRSKTSALLSGLLWCGEHGGDGIRMHRCTVNGRHGYTCPECSQVISNFEHLVVAEFLRQKGERVRWTRVEEVHEGGAALLPEIEHRLDELDQLIRQATDREVRRELQQQQADLLDLRDAKREEAPNVSLRYEDAGWFEDAWASAGEDVEAQRAVLDDAMERIWVRRGGTGRRTPAQVLARLTIDWKVPEDLGPVDGV
ncbi:DNA invertase Pin-like site-specific DNA recombinase [Geodermatophilus bullaregiensis]|uniref:recombinase family protein n=1 Tax=Geodermatophilus bullaregiensis TaxID=1564160 RepID=UPI00195C70C0|nr:recombinase family protein [Geodermatophilus bullaregiensis]MBM7807649.1 DNA invertase Pin-like site-specific DNA recombinase [Geodermatophilus bullaregiensis]